MPKRILVAGGAGFIGSHLCERLINEENEVHCLDNLYTGTEFNLKNIGKFKFHHKDINELKSKHYKKKFDEIYNLACPASPVHYQKDPIFTWKTNVLGTLNLIELAQKHNAKFLQASTSEVYGEPLSHPQEESLWTYINPVGIRPEAVDLQR